MEMLSLAWSAVRSGGTRLVSSQRSASFSTGTPSWVASLNQRLSAADPEIEAIIRREEDRQRKSIILIPSENFTSMGVLDALGSVMQNKYSEGYPGARYYGGNEFIDQAESLCQQRALDLFQLDPNKWGVNVQSLSGSPANFEIYTALLEPHDRILALDLPSGGHLSHGYQLPTKKVSAVSKYFDTVGYRLDPNTGYVNYDEMEHIADFYRPKLIVCGGSAYARDWDFARMRKVADQHGAYLLADMSHISGLIAAGIGSNPFEHCDVFMTTSHKTLRGPRGAFIIFRKGVRSVTKSGEEIHYDLQQKINSSVFPGHQGGPHNHTITALAVALKQAKSPEYKQYAQQVVANCKHFANELLARGFDLVSGGTDNHLVLADLRKKGVDGARVERVLELCNIAANKNTVPGDRSAMMPSGLRLGTPAMTTRGFREQDFTQVADFLNRGVDIAVEIKAQTGTKLKDFKAALEDGQPLPPKLQALKEEVSQFAASFPTVGF